MRKCTTLINNQIYKCCLITMFISAHQNEPRLRAINLGFTSKRIPQRLFNRRNSRKNRSTQKHGFKVCIRIRKRRKNQNSEKNRTRQNVRYSQKIILYLFLFVYEIFENNGLLANSLVIFDQPTKFEKYSDYRAISEYFRTTGGS